MGCCSIIVGLLFLIKRESLLIRFELIFKDFLYLNYFN